VCVLCACVCVCVCVCIDISFQLILPRNWTAMGQEHYVQIELKPTDADYKTVSAAFTSTGGPNTIQKVIVEAML
jgi:hypothetical protein